MSIFDAAQRYKRDGLDTVVIGGKEYGTGSSRDWAAKGPKLLGVRAVITESFERIHRSNLIGMGVLPLQFEDGGTWKGLNLTGEETVSIAGVAGVRVRQKMIVQIKRKSGEIVSVPVLCRIDTENELDYFNNGGILPFVLRNLAKAA